ncbi:MAG: alpha/beta hydrolase-fold protein [Ferruginibacter sp.]
MRYIKYCTGILLLNIFLLHSLQAQLPVPYTGNMKGYENFPSKYVDARNIDIWLPDDYNAKDKYAVLYMQDGQMLYDSTITWNKQEWGVDETLGVLLAEKKIRKCIVVGIWNSGKGRWADYLPQKPFETLSKAEQDSLYFSQRTNGPAIFNGIKIHSDDYLKFIVTELKPFVDSAFSTHKDAVNTFIAGSSMGALISIYAMCEYPKVFGGAACLSTHWPGIFITENNPLPDLFLKYLEKNLPSPVNHKIYFDHGTATLDALYKPYQVKADILVKQKGYTSKNWVTKEFAGEDHSEAAWKKRFAIPALFLLKP